jgi:Ca2+-binding RTX toxin-like protein
MGVFYGTDLADSMNYLNNPPVAPATAHSIHAKGGNDTVNGSYATDFIYGDTGNDSLIGWSGDDILFGGSNSTSVLSGADSLYGADGQDFLLGEDGNDLLMGGLDSDTLAGGLGNDQYHHWQADGGVDTIFDDASATLTPGFGGGTADVLYFRDVNAADLDAFTVAGSNDLWIASIADASDGVIDGGVRIQDFYLGGNNVIEYLVTADGYTFDLTLLL